ncbi:hypothetical protein Trydic_g3929 [Trypoxylus dichotomus]
MRHHHQTGPARGPITKLKRTGRINSGKSRKRRVSLIRTAYTGGWLRLISNMESATGRRNGCTCLYERHINEETVLIKCRALAVAKQLGTINTWVRNSEEEGNQRKLNESQRTLKMFGLQLHVTQHDRRGNTQQR